MIFCCRHSISLLVCHFQNCLLSRIRVRNPDFRSRYFFNCHAICFRSLNGNFSSFCMSHTKIDFGIFRWDLETFRRNGYRHTMICHCIFPCRRGSFYRILWFLSFGLYLLCIFRCFHIQTRLFFLYITAITISFIRFELNPIIFFFQSEILQFFLSIRHIHIIKLVFLQIFIFQIKKWVFFHIINPIFIGQIFLKFCLF